MDFQEFRRKVLKLNEPRVHRVTNSYGVYDAYKYYRKNRPKNSKYVLTESEYFSIIRQINLILGDKLLEGRDIILPRRMGSIELRKRPAKVEFIDGEVVDNLPIDWNTTLKLWSEDEGSYNEKKLIKLEEKEIFSIYYSKRKANYNNKVFYRFDANRQLKVRLKDLIKNNKIDAFQLWHSNSKV